MAKGAENGAGTAKKKVAEADNAASSGSDNGGSGLISVELAARLVMVTPRRIQQLVREGYVPAPVRGRYQTVGVVQGYIRSLQDEKKDSSRSERENRVRDARAREIELRIAERDRSLIEIEEHDAIVDELVGMVREEFGSLPSQVTRDPERKRDLEDKIDDVFNRIAARVLKRAQELSEDGAASSDDEEDDA